MELSWKDITSLRDEEKLMKWELKVRAQTTQIWSLESRLKRLRRGEAMITISTAETEDVSG